MSNPPDAFGAYEAPGRLPPPFELPAPSRTPVLVSGLATALVLGLVLFAASQLVYVWVVYSVALGLALGYALAVGVRWGSSPAGVVGPAMLCSTLVYLVLNGALYVGAVREVGGTWPGVLDFVAYRATHQALPLGLSPGPAINIVAWILEIVLTGVVAWRTAAPTVGRVRLESVPTPVTEFVLYLLFQGRGTNEIKTELAEHGWTEPADVVRALDAAGAAVNLIGPPAPPKKLPD